MCSSGCKTQDHESWGACVRDKGVRIDPVGLDMTKERQAQSERNAYRAVRAEGIQPESSKPRDVRAAVEISNATGTAYKGV